MDYKHTPEVTRELYQSMCKCVLVDPQYVPLQQIECDQESVSMMFSLGIAPSITGRFLRYWANIFESMDLHAEVKKNQITIHAPYDDVLAAVNTKIEELQIPEVKETDNDEKIAALEQWREMHGDTSRTEYLTEEELKQIITELQQQYSQFRR